MAQVLNEWDIGNFRMFSKLPKFESSYF